MNEAQIRSILTTGMFKNTFSKVLCMDEALEKIPHYLTKMKDIWSIFVVNTTFRHSNLKDGHWFVILIRNFQVILFDSYTMEHKAIMSMLYKNDFKRCNITLSPFIVQAFQTNTCGLHVIFICFYIVIRSMSYQYIYIYKLI